jgi:hypothetical protein
MSAEKRRLRIACSDAGCRWPTSHPLPFTRSEKPDADHLAVARYQGRRVTTVAKALRCHEELAVLA